MSNTETAEAELELLESMHERVAKLRSSLKTLELDTYSAMGITEQDLIDSAEDADGVSKNYR